MRAGDFREPIRRRVEKLKSECHPTDPSTSLTLMPAKDLAVNQENARSFTPLTTLRVRSERRSIGIRSAGQQSQPC